MSVCRGQALINAPPSAIWRLVGDPRRFAEWWPGIIEVRGEEFEQGSRFAQVAKGPISASETTMAIDRLDDLREVCLRCTDTGAYTRWLLTEAQGNTFVDVEFGMEPIGMKNRLFDASIGKMFFRRWLEQSLAGLEEVVAKGDGDPTP